MPTVWSLEPSVQFSQQLNLQSKMCKQTVHNDNNNNKLDLMSSTEQKFEDISETARQAMANLSGVKASIKQSQETLPI